MADECICKINYDCRNKAIRGIAFAMPGISTGNLDFKPGSLRTSFHDLVSLDASCVAGGNVITTAI